MPKNKVQDVSQLSNDLLRSFEDEPMFSAVPDVPEGKGAQEAEPPPDKPAIEPQPSAREEAKSKPAVSKKNKLEAKKRSSKPFNLYLPEGDIKYMQDLGRVLGMTTTSIIKSWIDNHRTKNKVKVDEAVKQLEARQNLL